ncbi:MAG: DUF2214 family protein [Pseudomonadota bacterium]|nr:DUF2214 family protein [Pseudomonadota bacterium]
MITAAIDFLHIIALLGWAIGLLIIAMAPREAVSHDDLKGIVKVYQWTLVALLAAITAGLTLWLMVGKPAEFYSNNPLFHAKLSLVALLILLTVWPAAFFWRQRRTLTPDKRIEDTPGAITRLQKAAVAVVIVTPVLGWLVARGIGY